MIVCFLGVEIRVNSQIFINSYAFSIEKLQNQGIYTF